jgi:hypothetical protein
MRAVEWRHAPSRAASRPRRASALYLTVVAVSMLVAAIGLSVIATQRTDRRIQNTLISENQAGWCARAGMEMAFLYFEQVTDWRQRVGTGGVLFSQVPVGAGTCDVKVFDDGDSSVPDDESEPVRVVAIGNCAGSVVRLQARLTARPHPCLACAAFNPTNNDTEFRNNALIKGPVRSHGSIRGAFGIRLLGNASFETMAGYAIDFPLTPKSFVSTAIAAPSVNLAFYQNLATPINAGGGWTAQLKGCNFTPTCNSLGAPNSSGIYSIDAGGREVIIENIHVKGTLIITNTGGNRVRFQKGGWIEPGPLNYPVLLVDTNGVGNLEMSLDLDNLVESSIQLSVGGFPIGLFGVDFNENGSKFDVLPSYVRGIIWANTTVAYLGTNSWPFTGCLVNRHPIVDNSVSINNDPLLQTVAIPGFLDSGMRLVSGSFRDAP